MERIQTDKAPAAVGPYAQAVRAGGMVFISGQIPLDPATGVMVEGGVEEQTHQVLANLDAVVKAAGADRADIVKVTIFLTDLGAFEAVNRIYGDWLEGHRPARATVEVSALPKGALVEMDAIVVSGEKA